MGSSNKMLSPLNHAIASSMSSVVARFNDSSSSQISFEQFLPS